MIKFISARFSSRCAETGNRISKDDSILYDTESKKAYCSKSKFYLDEAERRAVASYVEAQENAYFDNFCLANRI